MSNITLNGKEFKPFLGEDDLQKSVQAVAERLNKDYEGKKPLFIGVLNGCFMFFSDLMKNLTIECEVSFVKLASYHGMKSTGNVSELIGLNNDLTNRDVVIVEDIVDTGNTLEKLYESLKIRNPKSLETATLLYKPDAYSKNIEVKYSAMEIPNKFVVGYGLDFDGLGRNLKSIYVNEENY